jgi:N-acyl-D-amino-acid deacylase
MGEGSSMGPLTPDMRARLVAAQQPDAAAADGRPAPYDITWTTLAEYLSELERRGVSTNVASFIGAATSREHVVGLENRAATAAELQVMRALVDREMQAGALGIGSSLIYAPGAYASTEELIELCRVAARWRGKYISHIRSEGRRLLEAIDELVRISREAGLPAEIYHLKAAGRSHRVGAACGAADHRQHVSLRGGRDRARCGSSALGTRWRLRRVPGPPWRPGPSN